MKFIFLVFLYITLSSCKQDVKKEYSIDNLQDKTKNDIAGTFYRKKNNDRSGVFIPGKIITEINFKKKYCHFKLLNIPMSGKYEIEDNYIYINTGSELGILSLEIISKNHLEGEGFIHGTFTKEKQDNKISKNSKIKNNPDKIYSEQLITTNESDTEENTGQSNHTTAPVSENTNSATEQSNDPFAFGGSSNGENGGSGNTYGSDGTGTEGTGGGSGSGKGRVRLNDPILTDLKSNVNAYIYLKLTIDAQGNVVSASNIKAQTTTSNQILINKVIYQVKKQVKYNKDAGAPLAKVFMTVKVDAE